MAHQRLVLLERMSTPVGHIRCLLNMIVTDGDINAHHLVMGERTSGLPGARVHHQCTIMEVAQFVHNVQDNNPAVLGEVHVPLVASGQLDGVICLIVGS